MTLRVFAPAKVNLHLTVGSVRDDGYHAVDTVLQTLAFGDAISITPDVPFRFSCSPNLGLLPEENLALRAARAMSARYGRPLEVAITVEKHVPAGAGLGGASADAAGVILGLAELWSPGCDPGGLSDVARGLGADVPFFLTGGAALYTGRGDILERSLRALDAPMVVVMPAEPVNTARAYLAFDHLKAESAPAPDRLIDSLGTGDTAGVARHLYNAMTPASVSLVPAIVGAMRVVAESHGVLGLAMAGSGSAVFGVCADAASAAACAASARDIGLWAVATHARQTGCSIERV